MSFFFFGTPCTLEKTHLGLLTETHEVGYYFCSLKPQIFMYSRWRHPPKTVSPRPYCRSRRGRNGLGSETTCTSPIVVYSKLTIDLIPSHEYD